MKLPAYPRYKPSGVEWLGDVPKHWEVKRLRWVGEAIIGLTYSPSDVVSECEGTLVLRSSNIQGGRIVFDDNVFVSTEIPQKLRTKADDIVICTRNGSRDLVGKTGKISERESGLTFGAFTAVFRSSANDYMFYVFNSGLFAFQAGLYQTSTIFQLTNGTINAFQIPLPPAPEQRVIAAFLDRETGRLDRLVAKKRELIERLQEKRAALIARTVTRGLNPKAKLKPSGIEWLGDVPEHWEVKKLSWLFLYAKGPNAATLTKEYVSDNTGDFPVYSGQTENEGLMGTMDSHSFDFASSVILVTTVGARAMTTRLISGKFSLSQNCALIIPKGKQLDVRYYEAALRPLFDYERRSISLIMQPSLRFDDLDRFRVPLPPSEEQRAIAEYLDEETAKIDGLVAKVGEAVERLQEYRTALITAAVTGKIDVRKVTVSS